ncbi:DUF732 domain-containing protein [Gordonia spumicola]|uniref:DUF732 domain-containing protein n=1 Tax=Gordonia spumicola TaxID=589161 RepID=UPI00225E6BA1|nr:DUF732 domain-containing protein [Gordonia spumicola]
MAQLKKDKVTVAFASDEEAVALGHKVCSDISKGTGVVDEAMSLKMSQDDAISIVGGATIFLCPPSAGGTPTMPSLAIPGLPG